MTNVTRFSGMRAKRTCWARAPSSSNRASPSKNRPSSRSRRFPLRALSATRSSMSLISPLARPHLHDVVEGVALDGYLAGVVDHPQQLLAGDTGGCLGAGQVLDALVLERAVDVVGPEVQRDGRRVLAQRHPVRLDVGEVVEEQAGRG